MNRVILLILILSIPFVSFANDSIVCQTGDQSKSVLITNFEETEDDTDFLLIKLSAKVSLITQDTQKAIRDFTINGTREIMPAGYSEQLKNDQEDFLMEEAFNGSLLNSWEQPLSVKFQGEFLNCKRQEIIF